MHCRYSFLITWDLYTHIFIQKSLVFAFLPNRSLTLLKEKSHLHNVHKEALVILLLINITFLPSGLRCSGKEDAWIALLIFWAFIINGMVPTIMTKHGWLNTNLSVWQTLHNNPYLGTLFRLLHMLLKTPQMTWVLWLLLLSSWWCCFLVSLG